MKTNNILIVNTFGIGDVLFTTPLLKEIKGNMPDSKIYFLCNRRNYALLRNDPDLVGVLIFEKDDFRQIFKKSKIKFFKKSAAFINDIKELKIDVAVDLTLNYQMNIILMLAGVRTRIGFDYKNRGMLLTHKIKLDGFNEKHVVEYYLDLLKFLGLNISKGHPLRSYASPEDKLAVDNFLKAKGLVGKVLVGIAAGGGKSWGEDARFRRWDSSNFAYVGKRLSDLDDIRILIFGTLEEKGICDEVLEKIGEKAVSLCSATNLGLLIEFLSRLGLLICNEGGLLHIAVSKGVKTISIFGPVNDKVYGPYPPSERHKIIYAEGLRCRPCYRDFRHKECEAIACLDSIDKDRVLETAKSSLGF